MSIKEPTGDVPPDKGSQENMSKLDKQRKEVSLVAKELCDSAFEKGGPVDNGKFEDALKIFVEATEEDPKYARAWLNRGWALIKLGRDDGEATEYFLKALEIDREFARQWLEKEIDKGELTKDYVERLLSREDSKK